MSSIPKTAHVILAAGASTRMKRPKQLLPWKHTSLLGWEIEKSLQLFSTNTYVILGANYDLIVDEVTKFPVTVLHHQNWQLGMGSTISFGIETIKNCNTDYSAVLITLVDQPLIDKEHVMLLLKLSEKNPTKITATSMGKKIGVPAVFPNTFFDNLILLQEDYGARYILNEHKKNVLTIDGLDKFVDIDTMSQYNELKEREHNRRATDNR